MPPPPPYPEPFVIAPRSGHHAQTFVILHGRGSNGQYFGEELLRTSIPDFGDLQSTFPDAKFIFPTAAKRRATIYKRTPTNQWFDNWSLETPEQRDELQFDGLRESSAFVHGLLEAEIGLVGAENVILWGLSQGCATSLISLLLWEGPRIAAMIGMCGWLPLRKRMLDAASEEVADDPDDPFAVEVGEEDGSDQRATFQKAAMYLRDELYLPPSTKASTPEIPVFLGHGTEDDRLPIQLGREAVDLLKILEVNVEYWEYDGLRHWYSEPMLRDIVSFIQAKAKWPVISAKAEGGATAQPNST